MVPPAPRQGYYISGGVSMTLVAIQNDDEWYPRWFGSGFELRFGQYVTSWMDLGLAFSGGAAKGKARSGAGGGLSVEAQFHPVEPWSIRTGAGLNVVTLEDSRDPDGETMGIAGDFYTLGLGYDFYPFYNIGDGSGSLAITPVVLLKVQPGNESAMMMGWFGVELTWWTGLPKNQLELPLDTAFQEQ